MSLEPYALLSLDQLHNAKRDLVHEHYLRLPTLGPIRKRLAKRRFASELRLIDVQIGRFARRRPPAS